MPFPTTASLPDAVKNALPKDAQKIYMKVFNSAHKQHGHEPRAHMTAWKAVGNAGFKKGNGGKYSK